MNCGWDNLSNTTVCLKCGQPLRMPENYANSQDIFISKEGHGEAIPKPTVLNVSSNEEKCRKTVVFSTTNEEENHSTVVQPIIECPNCNYPVVGGLWRMVEGVCNGYRLWHCEGEIALDFQPF